MEGQSQGAIQGAGLGPAASPKRVSRSLRALGPDPASDLESPRNSALSYLSPDTHQISVILASWFTENYVEVTLLASPLDWPLTFLQPLIPPLPPSPTSHKLLGHLEFCSCSFGSKKLWAKWYKQRPEHFTLFWAFWLKSIPENQVIMAES